MLETRFDGGPGRVDASRARTRVGEQGEVVRIVHQRAGLAGERESVFELADPLLVLTLAGERPAVEDRRHSLAVQVAVLACGLQRRLRVRARRREVEPALLDDRGLRERGGIAVPAAWIVGEPHRLLGAFPGAVRVPEKPEGECGPAVAGGAGVVAVGRRDRIEVLPVVGCDAEGAPLVGDVDEVGHLARLVAHRDVVFVDDHEEVAQLLFRRLEIRDFHAAHVHGLPGVMIHEYATGAHRLVTTLRDSGELRAIFERAAGQRADRL